MPAVSFRASRGLIGAVLAAFWLACLALAQDFGLDPEMLAAVEKKYGSPAKQRLLAWQQLIAAGRDLAEDEKMRRVNDFFNQNVEFVDDIALWHKSDYWATPIEFLVKGAGDCEDYSIAKYFTLVEMGVSDSKLRITYVKALELNQAHMVLTYFESPRSEPLVLDNLKTAILPAGKRRDLQPVYSFNGTGLWLAKSKGSGQRVGGSDRISLWTELKERMMEPPL